MKIAYVFEDTSIAGGNRVTFAQADALIERGHEVTLITKGGPPSWRATRGRFLFVREFDEVDASPFDFMIGTFWTTLPAVHRLAGARAIHLCQGYEGSFTAYQAQKGAIDAAYRLPMPKIVVSPHLVDLCRQFSDDVTYVGQIVDDIFFRDAPPPRNARPRVLLVGPMQADFKGIDVGYDAVRGLDVDLIRASQWPAAEGEHLAREFHVGISSRQMVELIATCDAYLAPSRHQEGFGLPAAEAMAGVVPGVMSEIPSFLGFDTVHDYALFAPENDARAMGAQLARLLGDEPLRASIARRGREVVEQFRAARTGERLERYFLARRT
jgi:glycosyltransferase involved in cell wall biosynthesis